jgi:asparagine synthase (glutamine-hydrolysing)
MCGIAGLIAPQRPDGIEPAVRSMMAALARRGPDSEGFESWPGLGLGHKRLAIIDLSPAGHQPMLSEDRSVGVVFNGCIYNFLELRSELRALGRRFRSNCDTEVLIHGYLQWGVERMAQRLRGMFAFAIWDEPQRTLSLVRDRLGVKPLVWAARNGEIAFASTVGALGKAGFCGPINPGAVLQFLDFGNVAADQCIFEDVHKLAPATILEWKDGKISETTYWKLPDWEESSKVSFEEAVEETERLLIDATRLRLCSDVPISALLSGGVDSTLVCWALSKLNANLTAFTVGTPGDSSDESAHARQMANQFGIPHEIVELPAEGPEMLAEMELAYSEPFASPSAQAMLRVSRAIRPKATVVLTGDGGDDVFLGYPFLHAAWLAQKTAQRLPQPAFPVLRLFSGALPAIGPSRRLRNFTRYAVSGLSAYLAATDRLPYLVRSGVVGERLRGVTLPHLNLQPSSHSAQNLLSEVLVHQHRCHFVGEFMPKVDGATMYHSLEARSPFLDQRLWEFAAKLPPALRLRGGELKAILREIVRRRISPEVANRKKQGFTVPVERWLAERWTSALDVLTKPNELERQGWVNRGSLAPLVAQARTEKRVRPQLWHLLLLEHWLQRQS